MIMKKTVLLLGLTALLLSVVPVQSFAEVVQPSDVDASQCKGSGLQSAEDFYDGEKSQSWLVSYNNGVLSITWLNLLGNCCPEGIQRQLFKEGDRLVFDAYDVTGPVSCDCLCLFDVGASFGGIEPGHYTLEFKDEMTVEVDLEEGVSRRFEELATVVNSLSEGEMTLSVDHGLVKAFCPGKFRIEVFDVAGVKVFSFDDSDSSELSLGHLPGKLCFIRMTSYAGKALTLKVAL